jgi:hypothetical protein
LYEAVRQENLKALSANPEHLPSLPIRGTRK